MSESPRLLVLETSAAVGQVAVALGPTLLGVRRLDQTRRHARDLAPAAAELLAAQSWTPRDLHAVVVGLGPGSYTGLRVGLMSAKTFAYAVGCVLLGVESFAAVAEQSPSSVDRVDILADAQQDKVYVQPFGRGAAGWRPLAPLCVRPFNAWLADRDPAAHVTGPGLYRWAEHVPADVRRLEADCWDPQLETQLRLGLARFLRGERDDPFSLEPLYLRPSAAEEQWKNRKPGGA